ncbi:MULTISPECIES: SixA phosphatase family protein [Thiomicrorhabdus]|uniref:Histidine phosphatase family protein n=1 Tax=Thiomicrorhabdus heinhorstiae TaxID=2748010 RepID=A0ABS0BUW3_9GAMM|nr:MULTISPECIES: histidine phosphatase family protein [Thiomicrorhabdus]MBF6057627.1 histidine phosphatase family protein [Thiomicrorhabdus heinhorstiae]
MKKLRELLLIRHAKSDWKNAEDLLDIERPLSEKGKKQAKKIGVWLKQQEIFPDLILVSPAVRAQQTLKRICNECPTETHTVDKLYNADLDTLIETLSEAPTAERIMLIGHNPGLEQLFQYLKNEHSTSEIQLFPTASIAHFILPGDWSHLEAGDGKLRQFIRPKEIQIKKPESASTV